ncbi:hypothetical protein SUGI_0685170 [Cryptomeria japonica]|nr:hypothetical protein SUGI_0685170 [Cryptomeria japonica]
MGNYFSSTSAQEELPLGEPITYEIEEAIRSAALHIAIFSEKYAESRWCLDELYLMVKTGTTIIPVFYHVQPSDLRWVAQGKGIYAPAFSKHQKRYSQEKLEEWKGALKEVSNLMGYPLNSPNAHEGKLLKEIVDYCKEKMGKVREKEPNPERDQVFHSKLVSTELNEGPFSMGMFGGGGGGSWDDGIHSGIREIVVTFGSVVDSITVRYDQKGLPQWSECRGGTGAPSTNTETVKLDFPNEVLMSISGQYGQKWNHDGIKAVKCLTFHTNLRKYGPFGNHNRLIEGETEERIDFVTPSYGCKILGFYGRHGTYLDAIGVHWKPISTELNEGPFSMGLFGGGGGGCWDDGLIYSGIHQIVLTVGTCVDSITIQYDLDGLPLWSKRHGGTDSHKTEKVKFDFPNETNSWIKVGGPLVVDPRGGGSLLVDPSGGSSLVEVVNLGGGVSLVVQDYNTMVHS